MPNKTFATIPTQGVHHLTLVGASRKISIDFWQGVLGMPFVFEQPNLDNADESHLYFDPGDGRLITIFTDKKILKQKLVQWPIIFPPNKVILRGKKNAGKKSNEMIIIPKKNEIKNIFFLIIIAKS